MKHSVVVERLLYYILPLYFFVAFIEFFGGIYRLLLIVKVLAIIVSIYFLLKQPRQNIYKLLWIIIILNVFSFPFTLLDGRPFHCYLNEMVNYVPAMLFFFVGANPLVDSMRFYKYFLLSVVFSFLLGLIFYFSTPEWYLTRLADWYNKSAISMIELNVDNVLRQTRFTSYLMSEYAVSHFSMFGLAVALFWYFSSVGNKFFNLFSIFILTTSAILSQMRVAMFCSIAAIVFLVIYDVFIGGGKKAALLIFLIAFFLSLTLFFVQNKNREQVELALELVTQRAEKININEAMSERSYQWDFLYDDIRQPLIGHGLGAGGAVARYYGFPGVTDNNWVKIIYENGLFGLFLFLILIFTTLFKAVKKYRYYTIEIIIIIFTLVAMLGSNTLSFSYLYILPFWFALGRVWNKSSLDYMVKNNIRL